MPRAFEDLEEEVPTKRKVNKELIRWEFYDNSFPPPSHEPHDSYFVYSFSLSSFRLSASKKLWISLAVAFLE